jgi:hypothetical protein
MNDDGDDENMLYIEFSYMLYSLAFHIQTKLLNIKALLFWILELGFCILDNMQTHSQQ